MLKSERVAFYRKLAFVAYRDAVYEADNESEIKTIVRNLRESGGLTPQIESAAASGRLGWQVQRLRITALNRNINHNKWTK